MRPSLLALALCACGDHPDDLAAFVEKAAIVAHGACGDPAQIEAQVNLLPLHRQRLRVENGGLHLTGETWGDYVAWLDVDFAGSFDGLVESPGTHVEVVNHRVLDADLAAWCGLQLNLGLTLRHEGEITFSDRLPVMIRCD
jgi:hypothetical protein